MRQSTKEGDLWRVQRTFMDIRRSLREY